MSQTIYLHGLPGGAEELQIGPAPGWAVPDRLSWQGYEAGLATLAEDLPETFHLIGFSLGAMTALRLAALKPERIAEVTLISAAAPLDLGDFLSRMAGAPVFRAAMNAPERLARMTSLQAHFARLVPGLTLRLLFARTGPQERALALAHPYLIAGLLRRCYGPGRAAYLDELAAYVRPWSPELARVTAPVTLHHGGADRWSPPDMAGALARALPEARVIPHDGLGHYGTLAAVLEEMAA